MSDPFDRFTKALSDRYLIEEELGAGGMATVYLAEDVKHRRKVAVKVMRPELAAVLGPERFLREIEIAANLTHPHILPLHDSGEAEGFLYYVMPFIEGESLRDRIQREKQLPVDDAVEITQQVARALGYAHAHNVIHRDIKPENILLAGGEAMVADFGIAKAIQAAGGESLTGTGMSVGTPAYMSPEQAGGVEDLDGRSDLYSLGCMLFEALAGTTPFTGPTVESIIRQHMTADAPSVTVIRNAVPHRIAEVISRGMAKAPADRFATANEFADALKPGPVHAATVSMPNSNPVGRRWVGVGAAALLILGAVGWGITREVGSANGAAAIPRVVVLPLENLSGADDEYFADGMTEEITTKLAGLSGLRVIARQTAIQYKGSSLSAREIGGELDVDYVLAGTVRTDRAPDGSGQVRITPQLIRTSDDTPQWSEPYTVALVPGEIFEIQAEIATRIAEGMDVVLLEPELEAFSVRPTNNPEAYDYYLRGLDYRDRGVVNRLLEDRRLAVEMFERAVELDSNYVDAWVALARAHGQMFSTYAMPTASPLAETAADRVTELLPANHPTALRVQATYHSQIMRREDLAEEFLAAALRASPDDPNLFFDLAFMQRQLGRYEEALATYQEGLIRDPRHLERDRWLGATYREMRRFPEAEHHFDRTIERDPGSPWGHVLKMFLYLGWDGNTDRALPSREAANAMGDLSRFLLVSWDFDDAMLLRIFGDFSDRIPRLALQLPVDSAAYYLAHADLAAAGRAGESRAYFDSARVVLQGRLELHTGVRGDNGRLALAYAGLGRLDDAKRMAELDFASDTAASRMRMAGSFTGPRLARVYLMTGDHDAAVDRLEWLLSVPSIITVPLLRLDPLWDPLRDHPRFQRLMTGTN